MPVFLLLNLMSGILLVSKKLWLKRLLLLLFVFSLAIESTSLISNLEHLNKSKLGFYFLFYGVVTCEIIRQVWKTKIVGKNVILGLISGYISLGLLAFFLCFTIEILYPNSFSGLDLSNSAETDIDEQLMYFSYITLMTIGYGDITPASAVAQKATLFIGLTGQFYLVVLTAVVVGKYINQKISSS